MLKAVIVLWLLLIHGIALLAIVETDLAYRIDRKLSIGLLKPPEITPFYKDMLGSHLQLDGSVAPGSVIFLGDSLIQGLNASAVTFPDHPAINYGIGMDTSYGLLQRISQYTSLEKASKIVLAIGINDLIRTNRSHAGILKNYQQILQQLPTDVPVLMQAILPVDERIMPALNQQIRQLNQALSKLALQKGHTFMNLQALFADNDGNLRKTLHVGDGLHLSSEGYRVWINALKGQFISK